MQRSPTIDPTPARQDSPLGTDLLFDLGQVPRIGQGAPLLPAQVWMRGAIAEHPEWLSGKVVAIVGARAASRPALELTHTLASELARRGWLVVSGGAIGVDAAAHEGALAVGGRTLAVLGTGLDIVYPERHAGLFRSILPSGGLMTAFPLGTPARQGHFPKRNPIIAALADVVVIVEAGLRSGSLGTASAARTLGRRLLARPGSPGCDALLATRRAAAAADAETLVALVTGERVPELDAPSPEAAHLLAALAEPASAQELAQALDSLSIVLEGLCELELSRRTIRLQDGRYLALPGTADLKE